MEQHLITPGAHNVQRSNHSAQHPVFIADMLLGQPGDAVAFLVPADDSVIIIIGGGEIAKGRVLRPLDDGGGNRGNGGEVHIRHPHGDGVETLTGGAGGETAGLSNGIHSNGVPSAAVHDGGEIVFHRKSFPSKVK